MSLNVSSDSKNASVSAVVTRANGKVEDLGVIAYHNRNPFMRWAVNLWIFLKQLTRRN